MHSKNPESPLSEKQLDRFHKKGFVVVEGLLTESEVEHFVDSESRPKPAELRRAPLCNHTVDPDWMHFARHSRVVPIVQQLLDGAPRIVQTMYLEKPPCTDGKLSQEVAGTSWHQDVHYIRNEPNTLLGCWLALTDTGPENGGLCAIPGSHMGGLRSTDVNRDQEHVQWEGEEPMRAPDGREWTERMHAVQITGIEDSEIEILTVPRGGGVFFSNMLIHGSYANRSPTNFRKAFTIHYVKEGTWVYRVDIQDTLPV